MNNEREAIVRWLRKQSELSAKHSNATRNRGDANYHTGKEVAFSDAADIIEAGDHLKESTYE